MGFLAMLQGGKSGACGSRKVRIMLTPDAKLEAIRKGISVADTTICLMPTCGRALADMQKLQSILGLLQ